MEPNPRSATRPTTGFAQRLKEDGRRTLEQRKRSAAERVDESSVVPGEGRTGGARLGFDEGEGANHERVLVMKSCGARSTAHVAIALFTTHP